MRLAVVRVTVVRVTVVRVTVVTVKGFYGVECSVSNLRRFESIFDDRTINTNTRHRSGF